MLKIEISTTNPKIFWCFSMGQEEAMEEELFTLFPRNHSQTRGILKNPQIFKHEKCEQICFSQKSATTTVEVKSLVPFTAESRNLKSRQTCNRTSAPLDKSTKNVHFCNTCACCCCLSKQTYKLNAVKIIKWHGIQLLYWGRISSAPMLWCPSTWSTIVKFFADWVLLVA